MNELADRVLNFDVRLIRNIAKRFKGRVHGFWTTDDWGTQSGLMISISMWREFFKERYRRIFDKIHYARMHVWFHSCGKINKIIDELISIGVDVVNSFQPALLGIEEIGSKYAGRVCFETCADIQTTLPFGSDEDVRNEVKKLVQNLLNALKECESPPRV
jgi:uroporphyrinogen decarboxylase